MVASYNRKNVASDALLDMEISAQVYFEDQVLESTALNMSRPEFARKELAQLARSYDVPLEVMEELASTLMKDRLNIDLEEQEFTRMVEQVRSIEAIVDAGLREFKLARLAKRLKLPQTAMMNAYHKALINQAPFQAYGVDELDKLCVQVKEWLVGGWIPKGIVLLLHALGGAGKSLLIYELIECIVKGQPWNGYPVSQGRVLILQSDEPVVVTRERLKIRQLEQSHPVKVVPGWQVENMARLEAALKEYKDAGDPVTFCMVDSVTAINRNTLISENDTEYARFMLQLGDLGDRYGCTFMVVHHSNSDGESRGTKALYNSASEVWGLTVADEQSGERILRVQKTRMGRPPGRYKFQFDEENFTFSYLGQEGDELGEEAVHTEKRIELWLNEDEQRGIAYEVEEIAHHLNLNKHTCRKILREMWAKGMVSRCLKGQGNTMLYHIGPRRSPDPSRSTRDRPAIDTETRATPTKNAPVDRSIAKNEEISLLRNTKNGDRPIYTAPKAIEDETLGVDRGVDRGSIAGRSTPPLIENDEPRDRPVEVGDLVIVNATATWFKYQSDKISYSKLPRKYKDSSLFPINELSDEDLFFELTDVSKVLSMKSDRVRVRNQKTGRTSVFKISDVRVLEKNHD